MSHEDNIPLFKVHMPANASDLVAETLNSGYISEGEKVKLFEKGLQDFIGCRDILTVNSCTSAITLSLAHAGVGYGDDVVTTPMSCVATNMPILSLGANVVWADIDPNTGNITADTLEAAITPKTKAVCYVHWAGQPADIDGIMRVARKHGIKVIEDAAHALGSTYKGRMIGNHGDYVCYSFQAIKHLTTADGGAIAMNGHSPEEVQRLLKMRWFGLDRAFARSATKWEADISDIGFKMHMNDLNATLGLAQLPYADFIVQSHMSNGKVLDKCVKNCLGIELVNKLPDTESAYWIYTLLLSDASKRDAFAGYMQDLGIATNVVHVRNDKYSIFNNYKKYLPGVDYFCSRMINIPCGWWLSGKHMDRIVKALENACF
jgi:dTDP-4-amino-4,6-dideoxygalactose transaminase